MRIYAVDGDPDYPIHGAIKTECGWESACWDSDGYALSADDEDVRDLIEKPKTVKVSLWVNVYEDGDHVAFYTEEGAHTCAPQNRIACIHIDREVTEGEGL